VKKIIFIFSIIALASFTFYTRSLIYKKVHNPNKPISITIKKGQYWKSLEKLFLEKDIAIPYWHIKIWTLLKKQALLKSGEYLIPRNSTTHSILTVLSSGKSINYQVTLPEGYNIYDIHNTLQKTQIKNKENFLTLVKDPNFIQEISSQLELNEAIDSLEGFLYPETYSFTKDMDIKTFIQSMISEYKKNIIPLYQLNKTKLSHYDILKLASIIEKESGADQREHRVISSVFWNRIKKGMMLQSDPTIIYPLFPNFDGNIKRRHIKMKNEYNTYQMKGLPKTPICSPNKISYRATMEPDNTPYFYFVSKNNGTHSFSVTYKEHLRKVREYQLRKR